GKGRRVRKRSSKETPRIGKPAGRGAATRLLDRALERIRLFHLRPHRVQIVTGGDHREKQHENTYQHQTGTKAAVAIGMSRLDWLAPDPDRRRGQSQPE